MPSSSSRSKRRRSDSSSLASPMKQRHRSRTEQKHKTDHHNHGTRKAVNLLTDQNDLLAASTRIVVQNQDEETKKSRDHQAKPMDVNDIEVVDLRTPVTEPARVIVARSVQPTVTVAADVVVAAAAAAAASSNQISYESRTLTVNSRRQSILPAFPASIDIDDHPDLLLANVPNHLLTEQECNRRRCTKYRPPFHVVGAPPTSILVNTNIPSFFWPIYQELFGNLVEHLRVDMSIIDYNYARLSKCIDIWANEGIVRFQKKSHEVTLIQREYAIALEFFLQIDVDLFYMKTCSFRGVQRDESNKLFFCVTDPRARHEMTACGNCGLCYPKYDTRKRRQPSVKFGPAQRHQFVNKYESILNCPCSCYTSNIVYVLTCPCGKFDYIGESGSTLAERLEGFSSLHGNRVMHESFVGRANISLMHDNDIRPVDMRRKDEMHLYRHSIECPAAIQMFLDENPRYWRFVPMSNEEANQTEQIVTVSTMDIKSTKVHEDEKIKLFIANLPTPPPNYRFSQRQYHQQYAYFQPKRNLLMPNLHLDLYNATIVAVMPEGGSTVLRQIVEALLITHAQTKLNSASNLLGNNKSHESIYEGNVWCKDLVRRPLTSFITTSTIAAMKNTTLSN